MWPLRFHTLSLKVSKIQVTGLPWWSSGQDSACHCRGRRFHPWPGSLDRTCFGTTNPWAATAKPELSRPRAGTTEARAPKACARQQETQHHGKPELHAGSSPCSPRLEKTYAQQQRPSTAISQSLKQKMQLVSLKMAEAGLEKAMEAPGTVAGVGSTHMGQQPVLQPRWVQGRRAQGSATEGPEAAPHLGREPAGGQAR